MRVRRFLPLLTAATLGLPVAALGQQPSDSHLNDLNDPLPKDFTRLLDVGRGKRTANANDELLRLLKNMHLNVDPKNFDEKTIRNLLNDKQIKKFLDDNPNLKDPQNLQRMRDLVEKQRREAPKPNDPQWQNLEKVLKNLANPPDFSKTDRHGKPVEAPAEPPERARQQPPPAPKNDKQFDDISRWALRQLGDSPTTRDMANELVKIMGEGGLGADASAFLKDAEQEWKSLVGSTNDQSSSGTINDLANGLRLPDLGSLSIERSGSPGPAIDRAARDPSSGSWGDADGGPWTSLLLAALLALLGFFYWRRFIRPNQAGDKSAAGNRLAWPVEPHAVASRADVVKAFDYLSVARCGQDAVNWHHRQIAQRLSGQEPDKVEAVVSLAGLYEKARYAPAGDSFSDVEIAEARARLSQIAGNTSA